jgi:hypothetical protein
MLASFQSGVEVRIRLSYPPHIDGKSLHYISLSHGENIVGESSGTVFNYQFERTQWGVLHSAVLAKRTVDFLVEWPEELQNEPMNGLQA